MEKDRLRDLIIATVKRSILDMNFVLGIEVENKILDSHDDFMLQCNQVINKLQAILDYNFYQEDVDNVEPYQVDVIKLS